MGMKILQKYQASLCYQHSHTPTDSCSDVDRLHLLLISPRLLALEHQPRGKRKRTARGGRRARATSLRRVLAQVGRRARALAPGVGAVGGGVAVNHIEVGDDAGLLGDRDHAVVRRAVVRRMERGAGAVAARVVVAEVVRCAARCARALAPGVGAVGGSVAVDKIEVVYDAGLLGDRDHAEVIRTTVRRVERSAGAGTEAIVGAEAGGSAAAALLA